MVVVHVEPELALFLRRHRGSGVAEVPDDASSTLGHVVQAAGVPLTEVGALRVDGHAVETSTRATGLVVEVSPRPRPQALDGPPLLLLDVHLGTLARRLRLLGIDTAYRNDATDDELVEQAALDDRLLLTQDRGLLMRRALRRAAYVRGSRPDAQLRDVLDRFVLPLAPYTRCTACGGALESVAKDAVLHRLKPGTRRTQRHFARCLVCDRVYWHGAHGRRLDAVVRDAQDASRHQAVTGLS